MKKPVIFLCVLLVAQTLTATQAFCQPNTSSFRISGVAACPHLAEQQMLLKSESLAVTRSANMTRCQMLVLVSSNSLHWRLLRALGQDGGPRFSSSDIFSPLVMKASCQTNKSSHCPIFMWSVVSPNPVVNNNLNTASVFPKIEQRRLPGLILALHSGMNSVWDEYSPTPSLLLKPDGHVTQDYGFHSLFLPDEHFVVGAVVFRW